MNQKTLKIIVTVLSVLLACNLIFTAVLCVKVFGTDRKEQYVMYVGTNDKDTYTQLISTEDAIAAVDAICLRYLGGYTIAEGQGRWLDDENHMTVENTIICYFDDTDAATVHRIADEVIAALNQNSVLIETSDVKTEYYYGG